MDRQRVEECLARVAAYRASGQKAKVWAQANGMELGRLGSWCAHAGRWQAQLDGVAIEPSAATRSSGFVAARVVPSGTSSSVRIELNCAASRLELHWPLVHTRELAALLRELGR